MRRPFVFVSSLQRELVPVAARPRIRRGRSSRRATCRARRSPPPSRAMLVRRSGSLAAAARDRVGLVVRMRAFYAPWLGPGPRRWRWPTSPSACFLLGGRLRSRGSAAARAGVGPLLTLSGLTLVPRQPRRRGSLPPPRAARPPRALVPERAAATTGSPARSRRPPTPTLLILQPPARAVTRSTLALAAAVALAALLGLRQGSQKNRGRRQRPAAAAIGLAASLALSTALGLGAPRPGRGAGLCHDRALLWATTCLRRVGRGRAARRPAPRALGRTRPSAGLVVDLGAVRPTERRPCRREGSHGGPRRPRRSLLGYRLPESGAFVDDTGRPYRAPRARLRADRYEARATTA